MDSATETNNQKDNSCAAAAAPDNNDTSSTSAWCDSSEQNSIDGDQETQPAKERTQAQKKMDRVLANRRSAARSRERKKQLQQNLEVSVALLSKHNDHLNQENKALKQKVEMLSGILTELTKQPQGPSASDNVTLALLLQQIQSNANGPQNARGNDSFSSFSNRRI